MFRSVLVNSILLFQNGHYYLSLVSLALVSCVVLCTPLLSIYAAIEIRIVQLFVFKAIFFVIGAFIFRIRKKKKTNQRNQNEYGKKRFKANRKSVVLVGQ